MLFFLCSGRFARGVSIWAGCRSAGDRNTRLGTVSVQWRNEARASQVSCSPGDVRLIVRRWHIPSDQAERRFQAEKAVNTWFPYILPVVHAVL
jgi:hypothetical protein